MKIGILETDTVDEGVDNIYGSYADMFKKLLTKADEGLTYRIYQAYKYSLPNATDECDVYLITGSSYSVYDTENWINDLKEFIRQINKENKKLIGICFGHQIIAEALGGQVKKSDKGWGIGLMESKVLQHKNWMEPDRSYFYLLVTHQDQVISLPEEAVLIATNEFCINFGFMIKDHILTFQGHPEYEPEYLTYLMEKREKIIGNERVDVAKRSLRGSADGGLIAAWIVAFIKEGNL